MMKTIQQAIAKKLGREPTSEELAKELNGSGLLLWREKLKDEAIEKIKQAAMDAEEEMTLDELEEYADRVGAGGSS